MAFRLRWHWAKWFLKSNFLRYENKINLLTNEFCESEISFLSFCKCYLPVYLNAMIILDYCGNIKMNLKLSSCVLSVVLISEIVQKARFFCFDFFKNRFFFVTDPIFVSTFFFILSYTFTFLLLTKDIKIVPKRQKWPSPLTWFLFLLNFWRKCGSRVL